MFNENPWAKQRRPVCESCGIGRHWEAAACMDWEWASGMPVYRPWKELVLFTQVLALNKRGKSLLGEQLSLDHSVNLVVLAEKSGIGKSNLYRWKDASDGSQKWERSRTLCSREETNILSVIQSRSRVDQLLDRFEHSVERIEESARELERRFPGDTAVKEAVDNFLETVPTSNDNEHN
jgi:hypothetical protein